MGTPSNSGRSGAAVGHPLVVTILLGTLFVVSGFIVAGPATAMTVGTGYRVADLTDVQRAVDHLSFDGPAELQKAGVMVVDFILAISEREEPECDLYFGSQIDPYGTYRYASTWRGGGLAALGRVADHYCISWEQAQVFGAAVLTFLVGLDVEANGTTAGQGSADVPRVPADVEPVRLSGSGSHVELLPEPPPSDYQVLAYSHAGSGTFRVIGLDVAGNETEIVWAEASSSGRVVVEEPESFAAVRVVADGDWTLDFGPLTGVAEFTDAGPVAGVGNDVLLVPVGTGVTRPRFRHLDDGTFSVRFRGVDGEVIDFLEEEAGPLVSRFELPGGARILEVRATGEWALIHGDTLPPGRPPGLAVTSGDSSAEVSWSTPVSGGSPIIGYEVEHRRVSPGNGDDTWLVEVVPTGRSVHLSSLANGAAQQIRVRGFNADGPGLWTEIAISTPMPEVRHVEVVGLEGTAGDRSVDLAWEAPVGVMSYTVVYFDEDRVSAGGGVIRGGTGRRSVVVGPPGSVQAGLDHTGGLRQPLIVGGTKWTEGGGGYVVGLLDAANPDAFQAHYCGGTLVAPRWVVTAAHCVADRSIDEIDVIVGVVDLDEVGVDDRMNLAAIHVHELYDSERILHDIAVLELVEDGPGDPIPWQDDGTLPMEGTALRISGWGAVEADGAAYETALRSSTGRVLAGPDDDTCGSWQGFLSADELCVGSETGVGACVGDSGGPVVAELGMTRLVGVTSYGLSGACADPTFPNVATRVSGKSRWIEARVGDPWQEVVGIGAESYRIEGLVNGREYTFNVTAVDELGRSISPMTVTVTPVGPPAAPTGLNGGGGDSLAIMEWTAAFAGEEHPVISYVVEYSLSDGATWMVADGGASDLTIATVSDLVNETTVKVRVRAVNDLGIGPASGVVVVTIGRPEAPTGLVGRAGDGLGVLYWTAPVSEGGSTVLGYVVDRELDDGTWLPVGEYSLSSIGATVTGLVNGTTVRLRVAAVTAAGRGPASMTVVIVPGRPDAPTDLRAVSADGSLVLTWNPSAWDGGSPVTNHLIEVSSDGGVSWKVTGGDVGLGTTATVSGLENGTTYLLRVGSVSGLGSSRSTSVQAEPATVPGRPTDIVAIGGEGRLVLSWIRPPDGGRAITGIWVELAPADGGWQSFVAGPLTSSASIGGLVSGREYRVRVSYGNEIGSGPVSGEVRVLVR